MDENDNREFKEFAEWNFEEPVIADLIPTGAMTRSDDINNMLQSNDPCYNSENRV